MEKRKEQLIRVNVILFCIWFFCSFLGKVTAFSLFGKHFTLSVYLSVFLFPLFLVTYFICFRKNTTFNHVAKVFIGLISFLSISSLGMAFINFPISIDFSNSNSFTTWAEEIIKYSYDIFGIFYAIVLISNVKKKDIKIFALVFAFSYLIVGVAQIIVYFINNKTLNNIYDFFNFLGCFQTTATMERIRQNYRSFRFYGLSSEPAENSILIGCFVLPFFLYTFKNEFKNMKFISKILCIAFAIFFALCTLLTVSSSVFVGVIVFLFFVLIDFFTDKNHKRKSKILIACGLVGIIFMIMIIPASRNIIINSLLKILDFSDYSTQHRYSTIYNDILILLKSPLFGCGDGLQGYFYNKNITNSIFANNPETQMALRGELGLMSGGPTLPSLISGFGLVGLTVIFKNFVTIYNETKNKNTFYRENLLYIDASIVSILFLSVATQNIHFNASFYIVLALPFIFFSNKELNIYNQDAETGFNDLNVENYLILSV